MVGRTLRQPLITMPLYQPLPSSVGRTGDGLPAREIGQRCWAAAPMIMSPYMTEMKGLGRCGKRL